MDIAALVTFLNSTGFVNVSCHREFEPPIVQILLPLGLSLTLPYDTYEQVREACGLPEGVCNPDNTSS